MLCLPWFFLLLSTLVASRVISLAETAPESGPQLAERSLAQVGWAPPQPDLVEEL